MWESEEQKEVYFISSKLNSDFINNRVEGGDKLWQRLFY